MLWNFLEPAPRSRMAQFACRWTGLNFTHGLSKKLLAPSYEAWEAAVLPLNYARKSMILLPKLSFRRLAWHAFGTSIMGFVCGVVRANHIASCNVGRRVK